ncbi:hypothetical protein BGZ67_006232 [Mortierella alpina]|nr:hypothetical protein BGZ67_006232 [Mortierella alpina]
MQEFETRVNANLRLRKWHFVAYLPARQSFAQYLKARGWMVVECETEADLSIGSDCQSGDIAVTRDIGQHQKHSWDSRRAMEAEYAAAEDQLLK